MAKLRKEEIAREVHYLLELSIPSHSHIRASKAYKIVTIILDTITKALLSGESVLIPGFGEFSVRRPAPMGRVCTYFYGRKNGPRLYRTIKRKPYVHFEPHKPLIRYLNDPTYVKSQS